MVTSFKRLVNRMRSGGDPIQPKAPIAELTSEDLKLIEALVRLEQGEFAFEMRPFTDNELIEAAWSSLKIEEPDTTLEQVRKAILGSASALKDSSAASTKSESWKPGTSPI